MGLHSWEKTCAAEQKLSQGSEKGQRVRFRGEKDKGPRA